MSEDTFGIPAEDFDYQFVQAERAMMDLDAMNREAILGDPLSKEEAQRALETAYSEEPEDDGPGHWFVWDAEPNTPRPL